MKEKGIKGRSSIVRFTVILFYLNFLFLANWDGIHDYESGVLGYSMTVGREPCEEWLHPHYDPHAHLQPQDKDDTWTHIGVINTDDGVELAGEKHVSKKSQNRYNFKQI